jgi:hypothetical protein
MNHSTLNELKILVERVVRPINASTRRKRQIRDELLAHVSATFQEEAAESVDDQTALQRTAARFGTPAEVSEQIRASLPAWDHFARTVDALWTRPGESPLPRALRQAAILELLAVPALLLVLTLSASLNGKPISFTGLGLIARDLVAFFFVAAGFAFTAEWLSKDPRWSDSRQFWRNLLRVSAPLGALGFGICVAFQLARGGWRADDFYASAFITFWTLFALAITAQVSAARRQYEQDWEVLPL